MKVVSLLCDIQGAFGGVLNTLGQCLLTYASSGVSSPRLVIDFKYGSLAGTRIAEDAVEICCAHSIGWRGLFGVWSEEVYSTLCSIYYIWVGVRWGKSKIKSTSGVLSNRRDWYAMSIHFLIIAKKLENVNSKVRCWG